MKLFTRLITFIKQAFKGWCEAIDKMDYADRKAIANQNYGHYHF